MNQMQTRLCLLTNRTLGYNNGMNTLSAYLFCAFTITCLMFYYGCCNDALLEIIYFFGRALKVVIFNP